MSVKLHLFGPPRLIVNGEAKLLNGTNTAVLSLLALSPATHFQRSRSRIAGSIWPDSNEEHARQLLSNTLYRLRRILPNDQILLADNDNLQLKNIDIDVIQFQQLAQSNEPEKIEQAVQLYSGDLLEGHDPIWVLPMRVEFREQYLNLLSQTQTLLEENGELKTALLIANKWALADPLNESAHTAVMNLCVKLGRFGIAVQQFDTLTQLLDEELGVAPLPETQLLYEHIINERQKSVTPPKASQNIPFVGRNQERSQLLVQLDRLNTEGGVIFLEGAAGMGKTRLLAEIQKSAKWRHIRVGWGKQEENQAKNHYSPLPHALSELASPLWLDKIAPRLTQNNKKMLASWLPKLKAYLPPFEVGTPPSNTAKTIPIQFAIQKLLLALADACPTLIILDDLHWADDRLWDVLPKILTISKERPLLFLLSFRSQEIRENKKAWRALTEIERSFYPLHISLEGLPPNDCQALATHLNADISLEQATTYFQQCDGNPLFLKELILDKQNNSEAFAQTITNRLAKLNLNEQKALSAAAVLGREFPFNVWQRCVDEPIDLAKMLQSRLVSETSTGLAFEHDLVRAHIYDALSKEERRYWHHQAGIAIPETNRQLAKIAWHFEKAESWVQATHYYQKAAVFAHQVEDYESARHYCECALQPKAQPFLDETVKIELQLLWLELKHSSFWDEFDYEQFCALETRINQLNNPGLQRRFLLLKTNINTSQGKLESLEETFDALIELTPDELELSEKIKIYNQISYKLAANVRNIDKAIPFSKQAIEWAKELPQHPHLLVNSIFVLTLNYLYQRDLENIIDHLHWAESLIEKYPELAPMRTELLFYQAVWAQLSGNWEDARSKQHELIKIHRQTQNINELLSALFNATNVAVFTCQLEEGVMLVEELMAISEEFMVEMDAFYIHIYQGIAIETYSAVGAFAEANKIADKLCQWIETAENGHHKIRALTAVALLRFDEKRYEDAYQIGIQILSSINQDNSVTSRPYILLAEFAHLTHRQEEAQHHLQKAQDKFKPGVVSPNVFHYHYVNYLVKKSVTHLSKAYDVILLCAEKFNDFSLRLDFINRGSTQIDIFKQMAQHRQFKKVSLAHSEAPRGKPLSDSERVDVWWTIDNGAPDAKLLSEHGKIALRHHRLKRLVSQAQIYGATATHADLAQALDVTIRTIERDSKHLLEQGTSLITRGVAVKQPT